MNTHVSSSPLTRLGKIHHVDLNILDEPNDLPLPPLSRPYLHKSTLSILPPSTNPIFSHALPDYPRILHLTHHTASCRSLSLIPRSYSKTKLRSFGPTPMPVPTTDMDSSANTGRPSSRHHSRRGTGLRKSDYDSDSSWLTRTASALAMHAMEEKGQGWLASRASATSLSPVTMSHDYPGMLHGGDAAFEARTTKSTPASRYGSRVQSRTQSRVQSRVGSRAGSRSGSRADLRMTSQLQFSSSQQIATVPIAADIEAIEPDFVNLDEPDEEKEEQEFVDESEMRKLVWGRVGGWVDWAVGWMDLSVDDELESETNEHDGPELAGTETEQVGGNIRQKIAGEEDEMEREKGAEIQAPYNGGLWDDAKWLLTIAVRSF
ncbi:MAG: hypothetical protein Q9218_000813 [Villophora microphyllina]